MLQSPVFGLVKIANCNQSVSHTRLGERHLHDHARPEVLVELVGECWPGRMMIVLQVDDAVTKELRED